MRRPCSRDAILADLRRVYALTGSTTSYSYHALGAHATSTVYAHFPSWRAFVEAAGLPLTRRSTHPHRDRSDLGPSTRELERARRARQTVRTCLRCERRFLSDGPHNRRCDLCTSMVERCPTMAYAEWDV